MWHTQYFNLLPKWSSSLTLNADKSLSQNLLPCPQMSPEMFSHQQAAAFPPPNVSWCSLCTAIFPQEMSSDVKETFCHSFSFTVATEQQADIDVHYLSCAHTSEGPPEWSPPWIPLPTGAVTGQPLRRCISDGSKLYTAHTIFSQHKKMFFFLLLPPSLLTFTVLMWVQMHMISRV